MNDQQEITSIFLSESDSKLYPYKIKMEQVKAELLKFGLSQNQARVFIYLGKYGQKSAPEVSKALEIPRTETYFIINTLQNKGIVTAEFSTPTKYSTLTNWGSDFNACKVRAGKSKGSCNARARIDRTVERNTSFHG
ncbi:helix-turn-helix domain-containing protein [Candidatus Nitrosotalea sp. TS]|uniref:helix-turn-helix domain-containing protein n=1 Tax=Candidatus Nitrosotalea sp. TS TaxID=2341020 RepID=UPI00140E3C76|nr:helix-turn-helix domain-containing protein [Candidatus Nitrosotalea sp. TS]